MLTKRGRIAAATTVAALTAAGAPAGEVWDGGSLINSNWGSPNNWNPNGVPPNDGTADLVFAGTTRLSPVMDADWSVRSITFSSSAGAFGIAGAGHKLSVGAGGLTNSDSDTQSFAAGSVQLTSAQTWSASAGPLHIGIDGYLYQNGCDLTIGGDFDTTIDGGGSTNGGRTIIKNGGGRLTLGLTLVNQNLTINDGVVRLDGTVAVGTGIPTTWRVGLGSTLDLNGVTTSVGQLLERGQVVNNDQFLVLGGDDSSYTLSAAIDGSGQIVKDGVGTITLGTLFSNGCPEIRVREGTLISNGHINNAAVAVEVDTSAWLDIGTSDETLGSLAGNGFVDLNAQALTLAGDGTATKCSGIITGVGGSIRLNGKNARLNLASANDYTGGTVIRSGVASQPATLFANNASGSATGSGAVEVKSGGILGGDGAVSGAVTVESQGRIAPGGSEALLSDAGSLVLGGACYFASGSQFDVEIGGASAGTQYDQLDVAGQATLTGATLNVALIGGFKPAVGDSFSVLKFGSRTGLFSAGGLPAGFKVRANPIAKVVQAIYDCPGDADNSRAVTQDDIDIVLFNYGRTVAPGRDGDLDFNGVVNQDDVDIVLYYYGTSCS